MIHIWFRCETNGPLGEKQLPFYFESSPVDPRGCRIHTATAHPLSWLTPMTKNTTIRRTEWERPCQALPRTSRLFCLRKQPRPRGSHSAGGPSRCLYVYRIPTNEGKQGANQRAGQCSQLFRKHGYKCLIRDFPERAPNESDSKSAVPPRVQCVAYPSVTF